MPFDKTYILDDIAHIAESLINKHRVFAFYGAMGAGKTTLIKALLNALGAKDVGHSPTFGLVNEYHDIANQLLAYHFDFYRIDSLEEALDMGLEDYFLSDAYLFIEWPERIAPILPDDYCSVTLSFINDQTRHIICK